MSTFIAATRVASQGTKETDQPAWAQTLIAGLVLVFTVMLGRNAWVAPETTVLVLALPVFMNQVKLRFWPYLIAMAYFGSANVELPGVIDRFFPEGAGAVAMFGGPLLLTLIQSLPFLLYRPDRPPRERAIRMGAALLLLTLPPIGWLTWMNPLLAAGLLYPGTGYLGLLLMLATLVVLAAGGQKDSRKWVLAAGVPLLALAIGLNYWSRVNPPENLHQWVGFDTRIPPANQRDPFEVRTILPGNAITELSKAVMHDQTDVLVFPESILSPLTPADQVAMSTAVVEAQRRGIVILAGVVEQAGPDRWRNTIQAFGAQAGVVDESRLPMPMGNWRLSGGVPARPFASDLTMIETRRGPYVTAMSICYEDTLIWPHFGLLAGRADVMVSVSNSWATDNTRGRRTQEASAKLLARLAGVPLVRSENRWNPQ